MWLLPVIAVPLACATILLPGAKSWWWLGRVNVALFVALLVCSCKVVGGFIAPGAGSSAGVYGIIAVLCFGLIAAAVANAVAGALILAKHKPAFAGWFRARRLFGGLLMALAASPIGAAMAFAFCLILGVHVGVTSILSR